MEVENRTLIEQQIRRTFMNVVWNHKIQECCADYYSKTDNWLKITQIGLSALTTTGIVVTVFGDVEWATIASAIISAVLLALNMYLKGHDLPAKVEEHAKAAHEYLELQEAYLSFLVDLRTDELPDLTAIKSKRDALQERLNKVNSSAPRTFNRAVNMAKKALKVDNDSSYTEEEIDAYLLKGLKKG